MKDRKTNNRNYEIVFMVVGGMLLTAALLLTIFNICDNRRAEKGVEPIVEALVENQKMVKNKVQEERFYNKMLYSEIEMPAIEFGEKRYIGILEIPVLHLTLPVMEEWSYENLKIAPCCYTGSLYQDNLVLAGHNYKAHFGKLKTLPMGAEVKYTDVEGHIFSYYVGYTEIISGKDREKMMEGEWDLTLFTCTYGGKKRYTVRCIRQD